MSQEAQFISKVDVEALLEKQARNFEERIQKATVAGTVFSVDYDPETKFTYKSDGMSIPIKKDNPIMDHAKWMSIYYPNEEQKKALASSTFDKDMEEDCFTDEWRGHYQSFKGGMEKAMRGEALASSVITSNDFSNLLTTNLNVTRIIGFSIATQILEGSVSNMNVPNLKALFRKWSGFNVEPNVPEGVKAEAKKGSATESSFTIKKDVGAYAITIEAELITGQYGLGDISSLHTQEIARKMRILRDDKVLTAITSSTVTPVSSFDFGAVSGGVYTNDAAAELERAYNQVRTNSANEYEIDTFGSHPLVRRQYFANVLGSGAIGGLPFGSVPAQPTPGVFTAIPGIAFPASWYATNKFTTNTEMYAWDKEVIFIMEGPKRAVEIQRPDHEVREYYNRDFNSTNVVDQNGLIKLTSVTNGS